MERGPGAPARVPRRRSRPRRAGRRHRRRADLARRPRSSGGSRRAPTPTTAGGRWRSATCPPRWPCRAPTFEVEIIGHRRPARLLDEPVLDPAGERMRDLSGAAPRSRATPATARRRRRPPRRARSGGRVAAAGRPLARRQRQRPRPPPRDAGGDGRRRAAPVDRDAGGRAGRLAAPPARPVDDRTAPAVVAVDQRLAGEPRPGPPRDRGGGARRHRERPPGRRPRRPDRRVAGEHRAAPGRRGDGPGRRTVEASIVKAMFTGLVVDLLATGERPPASARRALALRQSSTWCGRRTTYSTASRTRWR